MDNIGKDIVIPAEFWLLDTEITQEQWALVMESKPPEPKSAQLPAHAVSWKDCQEFLKTFNRKYGSQFPGKRAALPSSGEWQYACDAGSTTRWHFGDNEAMLGHFAWFEGTSKDLDPNPVATKKPNQWGLYDMYGNVEEHCSDATGDGLRVTKGGYWDTPGALILNSKGVNAIAPHIKNEFSGFRIKIQ